MEKGTVYLLIEWGSSPERFKIGITKGSVEDRLKQLQTILNPIYTHQLFFFHPYIP